MTALDKIVGYFSPSALAKRLGAAKTVKMLSESVYNPRGRSQQTRDYHPFYPSNPNFGASFEHPDGQQRSMGLFSENAIGAGIVNAMVDGSIGNGLVLESAVKKSILGISDEQAAEIQKKIETYWNMWANNPSLSDHYGKQTFGSLQREAFITALSMGDILQHIKIVRINPSGMVVPQVQNIAGQCVRSNSLSSDNVVAGVETDANGREIAYHVAKNPSSESLPDPDSVRVPKYSTRGRLMYNFVTWGNIVPNQRRGRSILLRVAEQIIQMGRYSEAELVKAIIQSYMTIFITKSNDADESDPESSLLDQMKTASTGWNAYDADGNQIEATDSERQMSLAPGAIIELNKGENPVLPESKSPVAEFWHFMEAQLKMVGMAVGLPYEVLIKCFNSNYSASQAAIQDAARGWKISSTEWAYKYCQPVYEQFVEMLVRQGLIECDGFFDDEFKRLAWTSANWHGPVVLNIDPIKNVNASILAIDKRLTTREIEARKLFGNDFDAVVARSAEEEKLLASAGLTSAKPSQATNPGEKEVPNGDEQSDGE